MLKIQYRYAKTEDLKLICQFTDFWLSGRGLKKNAPGATNDCFFSPSQHSKYITKYETWLGFHRNQLIAWAVIHTSNTLLYFLIHGDFRNQGIGSDFLNYIHPRFVRSKSDQSSGDPAEFYKKLGFKLIRSEKSKGRFDIDKIRPNRAKTIDIFEKK